VNVSKGPLEVYHDVVHHIVTTGPPIAAKFRRLDGDKLKAVKGEFRQLQYRRMASFKGLPPPSLVSCIWCRKLMAAGDHAEIPADLTW
jgi:hypothetical protein